MFTKSQLENIQDVTIKDDQIICPHCKKVVKNKELTTKDNNKKILHGKCEGQIYFSDDISFFINEKLFENHSQYLKARVNNFVIKSLKNSKRK